MTLQKAYLTNNRYKLRKKLTDQLYELYCQEIDRFQNMKEVHTIRDIRYRGAVIKNIEQVNTMMILTLELKVCYYEYVEQNNVLIYGNRDKKVVVYYELKYITDFRDFISECPHCGAKSPDTFRRICEYCNETVEETDLKWYLNQENIVIKSYGDDIQKEVKYVYRFNSFSNIKISMNNIGKVTIKVNRLYNNEEIEILNKKVDEIYNQIITPEMTDADKIRAIHDYIINNTVYKNGC